MHLLNFCFFLLAVGCRHILVFANEEFDSPLPRYFVDPLLLQIMLKRLKTCKVKFSDESNGVFAMNELRHVANVSASEYFRAHELLAWHYFIENRHNNFHYTTDYSKAEMEYIPIIPLHWRTKQSLCTYSSFINMLLEFEEYLTKRDQSNLAKLPAHVNKTLPARFFIASTFNMRTMWGTGMKLQVRRGNEYDRITRLVQSLSVGHYERYPECPDLLRKSWKYVVELPYLSYEKIDDMDLLNDKIPPKDIFSFKNSPNFIPLKILQNKPFINEEHLPNKKITFLLIGQFEMIGPNKICDLRNEVLNLMNSRNDIMIVNTTRHQFSPLQTIKSEKIMSLIQQSVFCLILPSYSYSTSFLYSVIQNDCLPILINNNLINSFYFIINYELFTIRILENDFLKFSNQILNFLKIIYFENNFLLLKNSFKILNFYKNFLNYSKINFENLMNLLKFDKFFLQQQNFQNLQKNLKNKNLENFQTNIIFTLFLFELKYSLKINEFYKNIPCFKPFYCSDEKSNFIEISNSNLIKQFNNLFLNFTKNEKNFYKNLNLISLQNLNNLKENFIKLNTKFNYQILPIDIYKNHIESYKTHSSNQGTNQKIPHICEHHDRLIGYTKIVFFMQCVRVVWPLSPGKFKPIDNIFTNTTTNLPQFHREKGISLLEYDYVRAFHNITRPKNWNVYNFPIYNIKRDFIVDLEELN